MMIFCPQFRNLESFWNSWKFVMCGREYAMVVHVGPAVVVSPKWLVVVVGDVLSGSAAGLVREDTPLTPLASPVWVGQNNVHFPPASPVNKRLMNISGTMTLYCRCRAFVSPGPMPVFSWSTSRISACQISPPSSSPCDPVNRQAGPFPPCTESCRMRTDGKAKTFSPVSGRMRSRSL